VEAGILCLGGRNDKQTQKYRHKYDTVFHCSFIPLFFSFSASSSHTSTDLSSTLSSNIVSSPSSMLLSPPGTLSFSHRRPFSPIHRRPPSHCVFVTELLTGQATTSPVGLQIRDDGGFRWRRRDLNGIG